MKRITQNLKWLVTLLAMIVCTGAWAGDPETIVFSDQGYENAQDIVTVEVDDVNFSISFDKGTGSNTPKYYNTGSAIRCYGGNYFTVSSSSTIAKIELTFGNSDGSNTITTDNGSYSSGTWTGSASSVKFTIGGSTGHRRIASITVTYSSGDQQIISIPTFSLDEGSYTQAQSVTISCATDGASIYYTTDGTDPTTSSTKYTGAITISATTTLKAIASKDGETSSIASATYTILSQITIAEARAQGTGEVFTSGIVTSCVGTTAYIQDATAGICVFGDGDLTVGDEIKVQGKLSTFKGLLEITSPKCTVVSSNNTVNPVVKTIAEINADYSGSNTLQGILVKIENATVKSISGQNPTNTTIAQGENTIVVRGITGVEYAQNYIISLTGNVGCYDGVQIANPTNVKVSPAPSISLSTNTINVPAEGGEGTIEVTCKEFEPISIDLEFYKSDGTTPAEYDWIYAEIDESGNVNYIIDENTSGIRTAYFKVYGSISETNEVYSELITITQAVPSVTSLPFVFEGGKSDIPKTFGLTQEGLGSDYSTSPKLKFDGTGDNLILHFNERPGTLSFNIKGNGFAGGTFTVQTSEDGMNYTDLATYTDTELVGNTVLDEEFDNIGENVRYIKWIYTEKAQQPGGGNVGLGNISLTKYGQSLPYTLTITPNENAEIFVFYNDPENNWPNIQSGDKVTAGSEIIISVSANEEEGYQLEGVTVTDKDGLEVELTEEEEGISWTFTMPNSEVTVSCTCKLIEGEPTTYTLVTSTDDLSAGDEIIIVNVENDVAMSTTQNTNNRGQVSLENATWNSDGTAIEITQRDVQVLTLESSGDNWLFNTGKGYLYAASSSANQLKTEEEPDSKGNAVASIDISEEGDATITFQGENTRNLLRYNSNSKLFSCYASGQLPVQIFKKVASEVNYLGDANGDGDVDISDVVAVVNYILNDGATGNFVFENADVNGDGTVDISDVVGVVNMILNGELIIRE